MFEQYQHFHAADFASDDSFIEWAKRGRQASSAAFWQQFLVEHPEQKAEVDKAKHLVMALATAPEYQPEDAAVIWNQLETSVKTEPSRPGLWRVYRRPFRWAAAAAVALGAAFLWRLSTVPATGNMQASAPAEGIEAPGTDWQTVDNSGAQNKTITLPDGSQITLLPEAKVRYAAAFTGPEREVFLIGTAFFDVTRNEEQPFVVYSGDVVTRVIGTSFWVRANSLEKKVVVSVRTGRVSVSARAGVQKSPGASTKPVLLLPNQRAIFDAAQRAFTHTLAEQPLPLLDAKILETFMFKNAPVGQIFDAIEKVYGIEIEYDAALLANCLLTTSLKNETLFEKLAVVCKALDLTYTVEDTRVLVAGRKGCD